MSPAGIGVLALTVLVVAVAVELLRRRAARRRLEFFAAVSAAVKEGGGAVRSRNSALELSFGEEARLRIEEPSVLRLRDLPHARIVAALRSLATRPLGRLEGTLSLKIHGPRLLPVLVAPATLRLLGRHGLATTSFDPLGLETAYALDGDAGDCITEEHLREAGIDARDLDGIALAVSRQRLDEAALARLAVASVPVDCDEPLTAMALLAGGDLIDDGGSLDLEVDCKRPDLGPVAATLTSNGLRVR